MKYECTTPILSISLQIINKVSEDYYKRFTNNFINKINNSTNESLLEKIEELESRLTKYESIHEKPDILEFVYMKLIDNLSKNRYKSHEIYSEYKILDKHLYKIK